MRKYKKKSSIVYLLMSMILVSLVLYWIALSFARFTSTKHAVKAATTGGNIYGISGHLVGLSTVDLNKTLDDYKALGVQWVRDDFEWPQIQPNNANSYDWSGHDRIVAAATARGIRVLGIIDYTPQWELSSGCTDIYHCPPKSNTDYAVFAAAVATHYAPLGVHYWELWNEPNGGTFTVQNYTALIKATYPVIKHADANAFVLAGSMEPAATTGNAYAAIDFLSGIYQNGGKGYFDAVSDHPYCYGGENNNFHCPMTYADWSAWSQMQDTNPSLRSIMIQHGDQAKQIWGTEFGAPTGGGTHDYNLPVTEAQQAQMLTDAYTAWSSYSWAGPLFWYTYQDPCTTATSIECYFGLVHPDYAQKPAYTRYQQLALSAATTMTDTPMPDITPAISSNQTQLLITLCPHGLGNCGDNANPTGKGNLSPQHPTRAITLTFKDDTNQLTATMQDSVRYIDTEQNFQGQISLSIIPSGQYVVSVKMDKYLKKQFPGIVNVTRGKQTQLPEISLTTGDSNNDNQLDILDYNLLINCFRSKADTAMCQNQTASDINDDGVVDPIDYNLFLRELSVQKGN